MKSYIELQVPIRNDVRWFDELRTKMSEQGINVRWQNHNVIDKYRLYPDGVSAEKAAEEGKRRAFMNAFSNIQLFTDPET